jgi:hypothetical protein
MCRIHRREKDALPLRLPDTREDVSVMDDAAVVAIGDYITFLILLGLIM